MINNTEIFAGINKAVNFFLHTHQNGLLFCTCDHFAVIKEINRIIIHRTLMNNCRVQAISLAAADTQNYTEIIRMSMDGDTQGVIITNLNELIVFAGDGVIKDINFEREMLLALNIPILIWLAEENISRFANQAPDLFLRRDRGVIHFPCAEGIAGIDRLQDYYTKEYSESGDYQSLKLKMELLEKQLREAEQNGYNAQRIAEEIAIDLIDIYLAAHLNQEALELFEKYQDQLNLAESDKNIFIAGKLYSRTGEWDKALDFYHRSEEISEKVGDTAGIAITYNNIGLIYTPSRG